jgi:membrane protein YqaA with SNARE-associated domain
MDFFHDLALWFQSFAESDWSVVALFVGAFSESIFSPIPPDPLLIPMSVLNPSLAIWFGVVATLASVIGGVVGYWLGSRFGRRLIYKLMSENRVRSAESLFDKYGAWAVLVAAVTPIPFKVFTILAGILGLEMKMFILVSIIGRGLRFMSLGVLLFIFGEEIQGYIDRHFQNLSILAGLGVLVSIVLVWVIVKTRPHKKDAEGAV